MLCDMTWSQDQLTFLDDKLILIISSLGLVCVATAVLWVVRQSPDWGRIPANRLENEDLGDGVALGARTRVVPGGREATKAARKEAKKRAKAEFKRSQQSSAAQERRSRLQSQVRFSTWMRNVVLVMKTTRNAAVNEWAAEISSPTTGTAVALLLHVPAVRAVSSPFGVGLCCLTSPNCTGPTLLFDCLYLVFVRLVYE